MMKVKHRLFLSLAPSEQKLLLKVMEDEASRALFDSQKEMQIIWLKMMCIALHRLGLPEDQILIALGTWRALYRKNSRFNGEEEQSAWLAEELAKVFPNGFPEQVVQDFKKL